ncbi:sterol desaturase family protein [Roseibacterium sp. SDUM158016]|uniref:sterol desaturase family protein n=1 Tax=Roseicyclus sediminis TaxID=2980997 RepID=UPI0021D15CBA|nr:sterol desaturase family protein [Roseibacterium sp. SDUM158016]MCU4652182.1 sterol desaturase family protein [Roseibacterium sp. SDUM158016]
MSEILHELLELARAPFGHFTNTRDRLSYVYLGSALLVAIIVYVVTKAREGTLAAAGLVKWLLPKEVLLHPSCQTDFAYFFVVRLLRAAIYGSVVISSSAVSALTVAGLTSLLGPSAPTVEPSFWIAVGVTLVIVVVIDFTLWFMHYVYHVIPFLWDYHKVHHSAEVMTPITAARMHPVEEIMDMSVAGVVIGTVYGLFAYFLGPAAVQLTIFEVNVVLAVFFLAAFNLRHSHVWVRYPVWLQHIFVCPAQHQIHHSVAREHWDKNMGFIFAVWDWAAGTLYTPKGKEEITFGLGTEEDGGAWHSVSALMFRPFQQSAERIRTQFAPRRTR